MKLPKLSFSIRASVVLKFAMTAIVAVVVCANVAADEKAQFRAASLKMDITPDSPQWLHGYGPRKSAGVHDRIYHRIVAMNDGDDTFFLVSTDVATITPSFCDEVFARLQHETGVRPEQIWWSATHTHAAPHVGPQDLGELFSKTLGDRFSMKHDVEHWDFVVRQLIAGIRTAREQLEPARLTIEVDEASGNINRRHRTDDGRITLGENPEGPTDRQLGLLKLERPDGSLIALVANYAIHGTSLGGNNKLISGDIPGLVAEHVERATGAPMLFINGAEGNVGPLYSIGNNFDDPRLSKLTELLGNKIVAMSKSAGNATGDVQFVLGRAAIETPRRAGLGWLDALAAYSSVAADGTKMIRVPVFSLVINKEIIIWGAPLELFSEIAINIRDASPFSKTIYFGLTNGSLLYMPTSKAFEEGGYEVAISPFTPRAEHDFTTGVTRHLKHMKASGFNGDPK